MVLILIPQNLRVKKYEDGDWLSEEKLAKGKIIYIYTLICRTLDNSNFPQIRSDFYIPSYTFLYRFILDNSKSIFNFAD